MVQLTIFNPFIKTKTTFIFLTGAKTLRKKQSIYKILDTKIGGI